MNQNPRDRLLQLIIDLRMPMSPEEAKDHIAHLNDEEVGLLLPRYEAIKDYEDAVDAAAQEANPEEYAKIENKLNHDLLRTRQSVSLRKEQLQKEADDEMDKIQLKAEADIKDVLYQQQHELAEIEDEYKDIYTKMSTALMKAQANKTTQQEATPEQPES